MLLDAKRTPNWPQEGTLHESGGLWVSRHIGQSLPTKRITATSGRTMSDSQGSSSSLADELPAGNHGLANWTLLV